MTTAPALTAATAPSIDASYDNRWVLVVFWSTLLVLSLFSCVASASVLLFMAAHMGVVDAFAMKLTVKAAGFLLLTLSGGAALYRSRSKLAASTLIIEQRRLPIVYIAPVLLIAAACVIPRLGDYPWLAPDELHHLTVARNLAQHGVYASGHASTGLIEFDDYDSVGAPVLAPIAAAFKTAGVGVRQARLVMSAYFLLLCLLLFILIKPAAGPLPAAIGAACMICGFGSIYLGRTLYGEVPALTYMAAGLLAWRRGIADVGRGGWLMVAGLCFGLAVLCKTVLLFSVFAFLGAYVYDMATFRRVKFRHVAVPAIAGAAVIGAWLAIKCINQTSVAASADATLAAYRNYLVFSVRSVGAAVRWLIEQPSQPAAVAGALWVMPLIFRRRYDPALVVLWLLAVFYAYWWAFFTPARLPRYIWYSDAIGACFAGVLLVHLLKGTARARIAGVIIAALFAWNGVGEMRRVWTSDELRDEKAVAAYVVETAKHRPVATLSRPVAGLLNFLADSSIEIVQNAEQSAGKVLIIDSKVTDPPGGRAATRRFGRYLAYEEQVQ